MKNFLPPLGRQPLQLDYIAQHGRGYWLGWLIFVFGLIVMALLVNLYLRLSQQQELLLAQSTRFERAQQRSSVSSALSPQALLQVQSELRSANQVIAQLDLPWNSLFNAIEQSLPEQVALLGLQPDVAKRALTINAEAKNFAAMIDYLKRLQQQTALANVHLISHQVQQNDADRPVRFVVLAVWREGF